MAERKRTPAKSTGTKQTIYVDVDDEITNIIDKVKTSDGKIVALVLPKRAAVLQSVVNMKLLKRAGQSAKKGVVLITSETALLPLAGAAGLHVAKSLQSKPEIPPSPRASEDRVEEVSDTEPELDKSASVGSLAKADDEDETIELDNETVDLPADGTKPKKPKKLRQLKIPNFDRFKIGSVLAVVAVLGLAFAWYWAVKIAPKATITIKSDTETVVASFDFTASTKQTSVDLDKFAIPAQIREVAKTDEETVKATGEKNNGAKAAGSINVSGESCAPDIGTAPASIPAGSTIVSNGKSYKTQAGIDFDFDSFSSGSCALYTGSGDIVASEPGGDFNRDSGTEFTVNNRSAISATGSASGGTDDIKKVVTQKDIDDAVQAINERQKDAITTELKTLFETDGLYPLIESQVVKGKAKVKATPEKGKEASETTVSWEATYTMLGVNREDLRAIIAKDIEGEIDPEKQAISVDGIDSAIIRVNNNETAGEAFLNFRTSVIAGPQIDQAAIKEAIKGKKLGEVEKYVTSLPGVDDVTVEYSPFWVYQTPKNPNRITIVLEGNSENQ